MIKSREVADVSNASGSLAVVLAAAAEANPMLLVPGVSLSMLASQFAAAGGGEGIVGWQE